jgi:hypothetical protein
MYVMTKANRIKSIITAALLLGTSLMPAAAQNTPTAVAGWTIIQTGAVPCQQNYSTMEWKSQWVLHIVAIQIWNGLDDGTAADVIEQVTRKSDGSVLIWGNHDDYQNGGEVRIQKHGWNGNYYLLMPGDSLVLTYSCTWGVHGNWVVTFWVY